MSVDASLGDLAHATLVVSLGYLALDPFRYREAMEKMCQKAVRMAEGMPDQYKKDKAWADLKALAPTPSMRWLFRRSIDRVIAFTCAAVAAAVLATRMVADGAR